MLYMYLSVMLEVIAKCIPSILQLLQWGDQVQLQGDNDHDNCGECLLRLFLELHMYLGCCAFPKNYCTIQRPICQQHLQVVHFKLFSLLINHFSSIGASAINLAKNEVGLPKHFPATSWECSLSIVLSVIVSFLVHTLTGPMCKPFIILLLIAQSYNTSK